ncbi:hypothetical protein G3T20_05325 [Bordetella hinzii]|uniref:hypothetical protein n=1 Tax=Bordetella hinzii TaxID=103855 RepID=UPI0013EFEC48|nr:hypothetical protein [Bordetella hinzii]QII84173.1 hypothetical protein G3T20_05325 [Bordetella hinzii]
MSGAASAGGVSSAMSIIGLGTQIGGMVGGASTAKANAKIQQAQLDNQADAYAYQAQVSRNNAMVAEWQARSAIAAGGQQEQTLRLKTAALEGSQRARLAANGVDVSQGSAFNILADTKYMGERDAATVRLNAAQKAWAFRTQAQSDLDNADVLDISASNARRGASAISPSASYTSTLLTGAGQVASGWYKYSQAFASPTGVTQNNLDIANATDDPIASLWEQGVL